MDEKKLQEVFSDEAFVQSLYALDTAQEVQAALKEKGISLTLEEIEAIRKHLQSGEVTANELDGVAGGKSAGTLGFPFSWGFGMPIPPQRKVW